MAAIDLKNTIITIYDGTPSTPNSMQIRIGIGNITYTTKRQFIYTLNRGKLDTVRKGDEIPMEVKFEATYESYQLGSADAPLVSIRDFLTQQGNASSFITAGADPCEPYAVILTIVQAQCVAITDPTETITIPELRIDKKTFDIKAGQISFSGKAKVEAPTIVRS